MNLGSWLLFAGLFLEVFYAWYVWVWRIKRERELQRWARKLENLEEHLLIHKDIDPETALVILRNMDRERG